MYHPDLDPDRLAEIFRQDDRIRIKNILEPGYFEQTTLLLEKETVYATIVCVNGQGKAFGPAEVEAMSSEQKQQLHESLMRDAAQGNGFHYHGHQMAETRNQKLADFLEFLNSAQSIETIRRITGSTEITHADGQATRYLPGHYLTRHLDNPQGETRRFAYVFNFTRQWHPDWGGLLQFYEQEGTPRDAWAPGFNTLSLFDVRHIHAVTYIAPYARASRHSITGWFRV